MPCTTLPASNFKDIICGEITQNSSFLIHPSSFLMPRPLRVFLCHSSNDKPAVRELYQKLRAVPQGDDKPWIRPWLDEPILDWK